MLGREVWKVYGPLLAVALAGFIVAFSLMDPAPPHVVRFAAGAPGGAYHAYAERYQRLLAEQGLEVQLIETAGSVENLRLLTEDAADVALVQGGLVQPEDERVLRSLGGLFEEPIWVFVRSGVAANTFGDLRRLRFSVGPDGSGTRVAGRRLQAEYGGDWPDAAQLRLTSLEAEKAILAGEIDAVMFTASADAPYVQTLLRQSGINLMPFDRADALARRADALSPVVLLRGVVDIGADVPPRDVPLIAAIAQLTLRDDLHPAIEAVLLDAATAIHSEGSLFSEAGAFPDLAFADLPASRQTSRFYKNGPSFLRRYLPFGLANFLDRTWVLAIPLLTLAFPLVRAAPPIYRWRVRRKIYIWYKDLRELEARGRALPDAAERSTIHKELEDLQAEIGQLDVPLSYTDDLYRLRSHVEFVKQLVGQVRDNRTAAA